MTSKENIPAVEKASWKDKPITVLGLSKSGCAVSRYVQKRGGNTFLSELSPATDKNQPLREELEALGVEIEMGRHSKTVFTHSPLVVVSPGIPPSSPVLNQMTQSNLEIISEVEFAWRQNQAGDNKPVIGITGTNGKTTTTTLVSRVFEASGLNAPACGNIGLPVTEVVDKGDVDYYPLELSSAQLAFSPTLQCKTAIFLNLTPDHLNWHPSLEDYKRCKKSIFIGERSPEWIILWAGDTLSAEIAAQSKSRVLWYAIEEKLVAEKENRAYVDIEGQLTVNLGGSQKQFGPANALKLLGKHNIENVLAAVSCAAIHELPVDRVTEAVQTFTGIEHRLEPVKTIHSEGKTITFINDSKATNVDATVSALRSLGDRKIILLAGGRDKMTDLTPMIDYMHNNVLHAVVYGEAKNRFADEMQKQNYNHVEQTDDLESATHRALELASEAASDVLILLSPACASFDLYPNFEVRGRAFKEIVSRLNGIQAASTV